MHAGFLKQSKLDKIPSTEHPEAETTSGDTKLNGMDSNSHKPDPIQVLGGMILKESTQWERRHMQDKRYMVLQGLAVNPCYQRQGIATKLVQ